MMTDDQVEALARLVKRQLEKQGEHPPSFAQLERIIRILDKMDMLWSA